MLRGTYLHNGIFRNFQEATCNGKEATCPASLPMADSTKCIDRGECRGGKCIPFCETQDLQVRSINIYSTNMAQYALSTFCLLC